MACPGNGPCAPFVDALDLCCLVSGATPTDPCISGGQPVPQEQIDNALMAASEILWAATGRQFGTCTVTIRPCRAKCGPCGATSSDWFEVRDFGTGFGAFPWTPFLENGVWTNIPTVCGCEKSCCHVEGIPLPYPVCCVDEVKIDGVVLDPSAYKVQDFKTLVRIDGGSWPDCQNLAAPDTEPDTFSVTVTYGREVPALIKLAAAELACQFIKVCTKQPCQLPQRMQSMSRDGITVGFIDPMEFLKAGRTGIYIVDLAISQFNPHKLLKQASVYSPDVGKRWRVDTGGDCI